jgi:site-specific DNA-methyltransferase (adenine-specific)
METSLKGNALATRLKAAEDVIATAQKWNAEEAQALLRIRDGRLYRERYQTFEQYVADRWGMERTYAYRCCAWAEAMANVLPIGNIEREAHARPMYGLDADDQIAVWKAVKCITATPTAEIVTAAVKRHLDKRTPQTPSGTQQRLSGKIIVADARDGLKALKNGTLDLLLFSPPYAMQRAADYPGIPETKFPSWIVSILEAAKPKMTPKGNVLINIREHAKKGEIPDFVLRTRLAIRAAGWREIDTLIWLKPDNLATGRADRPRRSYEHILWYSATTDPYTDVRAIGKPLDDDKYLAPRFRLNKFSNHASKPFAISYGETSRVSDVVVAPIGGLRGNAHPTAYPVELCRQLIETYSPAGGRVADCCCGTGNALIAARDAGRRWFGIDIVPKFVNLARKRMATV